MIVLEGNISTGKSTLLKNLEKRGDIMAVYEKISNDLLKLFYSDSNKYALTTQLTTLCRRNNDIKYLKLQLQNIHNKVAIVDRSLFGDLGFFIAHYYDGRIDDNEVRAYASEFKLDEMDQTLKSIGTILYLYAETNRCKDSVLARNNVDSKVDVDYLKTLHQLHFHGLLYLKSKGVDVRFVDWEYFGDEYAIQQALKDNIGKCTVNFADRDNKDFTNVRNSEIFDYYESLVPLHTESLKKLEDKYRYVISDEVQKKIVSCLSVGKSVILVKDNNHRLHTKESLIDVFEVLKNKFV
jgi:deoxyadenosine/deoxycytidine kinase